MNPLRLMLFDRTCRGGRVMPGLSHAWSVGGVLYNKLGRIDAWHGVSSWAGGLDWLVDVSAKRPVIDNPMCPPALI